MNRTNNPPKQKTRGGARDRGVSEVVSFTLVFSLILVSVAIVSVSGFGVLNDVRTGEQIQNAARAYEVLGTNMEKVYAEGAPSRATEIDLGDGQVFLGEVTTFNVSVEYAGGGTDNWTREVSPIVFRVAPGHRLVYENGAIFQTRPDSGSIRREPPQFFSGERTIIPTIQTRSDTVQSIGSTTVLVRAEMRARSILLSSSDVDALYVNITSPQADLWKRYYEESVSRVDGDEVDCQQPVDDRVICDIKPGNAVYVTSNDIDISLIS